MLDQNGYYYFNFEQQSVYDCRPGGGAVLEDCVRSAVLYFKAQESTLLSRFESAIRDEVKVGDSSFSKVVDIMEHEV